MAYDNHGTQRVRGRNLGNIFLADAVDINKSIKEWFIAYVKMEDIFITL